MELPAVFGKEGSAAKLWNSPWVGIPLWSASAVFAVHWYFSIPSPGKAIGALAVVAGVMSVRDIKVLGKIAWVVILILMLVTEFRAIDDDRTKSQDAEDKHLREERESFSTILTNQANGFTQVLKDQQDNFRETIEQIINANTTDRKQFAGLVTRDEILLQHQEEVAESLNGSLSPGNETAPPLAAHCGYKKDDVVIIYGDNGDRALITELPVNLVRSTSKGILLTMRRRPDGNIVLTGDVKGRDGKVIVRLDSRGYVINHSGFLEVNKDQHNLRVSDDYGEEVLNLSYINPQIIRVSMPLLRTPGVQITCLSSHGNGPNTAIFGTP